MLSAPLPDAKGPHTEDSYKPAGHNLREDPTAAEGELSVTEEKATPPVEPEKDTQVEILRMQEETGAKPLQAERAVAGKGESMN